MSTEGILEQYAEQQGWNNASKLDLCLRYIEHQSDDTSFEDFLKYQADEENASTQKDFIIRFNARVIVSAETAEEAEEKFDEMDFGPAEDIDIDHTIDIDYTKEYGS